MSKKKQQSSDATPAAKPKNEIAFIVRKHSLQEWQLIDIELDGDKVVYRKEREPDLAAIVGTKLMNEIRKFNT